MRIQIQKPIECGSRSETLHLRLKLGNIRHKFTTKTADEEQK
jgi:hypothetical protein